MTVNDSQHFAWPAVNFLFHSGVCFIRAVNITLFSNRVIVYIAFNDVVYCSIGFRAKGSNAASDLRIGIIQYTEFVSIVQLLIQHTEFVSIVRAQELCESRGGRPGPLSLIYLRFLWT